MKVKLEEVVEALDFANEETQFLYDEKNEKIIMVYDGMVDGVKNPEFGSLTPLFTIDLKHSA